MVGAALLVARGILPMTAVEMALAAPIQLVLPLAPAEGLTLMYSGYMRNVNGQVRFAIVATAFSIECHLMTID